MTGNKRPSEIMITSFKYQPLHSHTCHNPKMNLLGDLLIHPLRRRTSDYAVDTILTFK